MTEGTHKSQQPRAELQGFSIVLVGQFQPNELVPGWFTGHGLMDPHAAEDLELEVILPDVSRYKLSWLGVSVEPNRVHFHTTDEKRSLPLRDLAHEFLRVKSEIRLRAMGVNAQAHFQSHSEESWNAIGHTLAPKATWSTILKDPGLLTMTVQGRREDGREGWVNVKVEPSARVQPGIYVEVNDHFQLATDDEMTDAVEAIRILEDSFEDIVARRSSYFENVMGIASVAE